MLILAMAGSWLAMSLARAPKDWLTQPHFLAAAFVLLIAAVAPSVVSTAVCYSVASVKPGRHRSPSVAG